MSVFFTDYTVERLIGEGGNGEVFAAKRKSDGLKVAIKAVKITPAVKFIDDDDGSLPLEIFLLKKISHVEGVVKMLDYLILDIKYYIILEFMDGDLFSLIQNRSLSEASCKIIFKQIFQTVMEIHKAGVFHGDLKLENILCDPSNFVTKIIDFGNGNIYKPGYLKTFQGTGDYCPPEYIMYNIHECNSTTIWTLGILLYEISQGQVPFKSQHEILKGHLKFKTPISNELQDLIHQCLTYYMNRSNFKTIKEHPWMKD